MNTMRGPSLSRRVADDELRHRGDGEHRRRSAELVADVAPVARDQAAVPGRSLSSNTFGSANVVDWKTMLEIAVVRKTIDRNAQQQRPWQSGGQLAAAAAVALGAARWPHDARASAAHGIGDADRDREQRPARTKAERQPPWSMK